MTIPLPAAIRAGLLLVCLCLTPAAHAQGASGTWSTNCAASHCTASARVRAKEPGVPYAYQLRVSRYEDTRTEMVLLTGKARPADEAVIHAAVDGKTAARLAPGSGYRRVGRSNTYVVNESDAMPLIQRMRSGRQLTLAFQSAGGADETVQLSLQGLDAALTKIGVKPQRAAAAEAPPEPAAKPAGEQRPAAKKKPASPAAKADAPPAKRERGGATEPPAESAAKPEAPPAPKPRADTGSATPEPAAPAPAAGSAELPAAALDGPGHSTPTAATRAAPPATTPPQSVSVPRQFACQGNEPFWNLSIDGEQARFVSLSGGGDARPVLLTGRLQATAETTGATFGWRGRSADGNSYGALIESRACRDTMSDREGITTFPYSATVAAPGGLTLQGCCTAGPSLDSKAGSHGEPSVRLSDLRGRAPEDWSRHLPDMLRAMEACLERTPGEGAYVTKAWPMNRGLVGVRTRNTSVGWFECVAQQDGRAIERFDPVDGKAERVPDEERLLFVPPSVARHEGNCFRHVRLLDEADRPLGWLTTNTCWRAPGAPPVATKRR